ncbi:MULTISPECIES: hypothetical protein [Pseudomonas]|uniref:hypothetical protein n=1 Tax=Pseudomonas TaxID=286 RepID=UPI001FFF756F|nr:MULTISPECIES: hypothetical protein [Pseudomonas]MDD1981810.1 hypothetical protein [Pseudomonas asiatica]UPK88663.1 hypothetical protein E5221_28520 [Pseudomonas sp. A2]
MDDLHASFYDPGMGREDIYNFEFQGVSRGVLVDLRNAFYELTGAYNYRSRRQAWRSVKKFIDFLSCNDDSSPELLREFGRSLEIQQLMLKTCQSHYNFISRMVAWLSENGSNKVWASQQYEYRKFPRESKSVRANHINAESLSDIVKACKKEILQIRSKLELRRMISQGEDIFDSELNADDLRNLKDLISLEGQGVWSQRDLAIPGISRLSHVGLRRLSAYRELSSRSILPIYILIMIETAANPISLLEIGAKCIEPHPTDESLSIISWNKPRSKSEQRVSFLKQGQFSIAHLVELVLNGTEQLRDIAGVDKDLLFITRSGGKAKRVSVQGMHNQLVRFRSEHALPKFTFVDIRRSIAELVNVKHRSPAHVANVLQHKGLSTVVRYINPKENNYKAFERISEIQGEMIGVATSEQTGNLEQTVFGISCNREDKARSCLEFTSCAVCKNALVVIDDPVYVARILKSKIYLEEMERAAVVHVDSAARFNHVYKVTLDVIRSQIIPEIKQAVIDRAERLLITTPDLPRMY